MNILKNFIDGKTYSNTSGETFDVINPATVKLAYKVEVAAAGVRAVAFVSANKGFAHWSLMSRIERSRLLL